MAGAFVAEAGGAELEALPHIVCARVEPRVQVLRLLRRSQHRVRAVVGLGVDGAHRHAGELGEELRGLGHAAAGADVHVGDDVVAQAQCLHLGGLAGVQPICVIRRHVVEELGLADLGRALLHRLDLRGVQRIVLLLHTAARGASEVSS